MRRDLGSGRHAPRARIIHSGHGFFSYSLYMMPAVQYRDGIEYLGRTRQRAGVAPTANDPLHCVLASAFPRARPCSAGTTDGR